MYVLPLKAIIIVILHCSSFMTRISNRYCHGKYFFLNKTYSIDDKFLKIIKNKYKNNNN